MTAGAAALCIAKMASSSCAELAFADAAAVALCLLFPIAELCCVRGEAAAAPGDRTPTGAAAAGGDRA